MTTDRQEINDFRLRVFAGAGDRVLAFVCECADPDCRRAVSMTRAEYEELRRSGAELLHPGHASLADTPMRAEKEWAQGSGSNVEQDAPKSGPAPL